MSSASIKVAIRCRPLMGQERPTGGLDIQSRRILLDSKTYDPDFTFPPTSTQDDVFHACRPILQCVKEGMNGTIMVYGQTGTGKTYTMLGNDEAEHGLVHKVVADMLDYVQQKTMDGAQCALTLSMIEIYNERLTDMLSPNGEEEVTLISGFPRFTHKVTLCRVHDAIETIQRGLAWRHTAATLMNERSSRSHVVFIFDLEEYNAFTEQTDVAHLFMIDLAGSESLKKSQASGVAAGEAGKINKSLLALKSVFLALSNTNEATRPGHVPYRDSKLTELLQDSIGGTARTLMIACISSVGRDIEETKSTLLYAVKARSIRNAANTEKEKLLVRLRSMEVENQKLRNRLQERVNERGGYFVTKEEHEQTAEMEESYGKMKEAVDQLMQDRQSSDARQHIWESQVKLLHALLEDKAAELQTFKEVYYEALKRFENQAATLQRLVRGGVGEAKDAVQLSFADNYARLHTWRTELLNALEEPLPTAMPVLSEERPEEDAFLPRQQQQQQQQGMSLQTQESNGGDGVVASSTNDRSATPPLPPPTSATGTTRHPPSLTPPISPVRSEQSNVATGQPSAASGNGTGRSFGASRSARGSAASMQRVSAASASGGGGASTSVSPTRRPGGGRPRGNANNYSAAAATMSSAVPRRATLHSSGAVLTSPSLAATHPQQHHSSPVPMDPPTSLLPATTRKASPMAAREGEEEEEREVMQEEESDVKMHKASSAAVAEEVSAPLQPGGASAPSSPFRLPRFPSQQTRVSELPPWSAVLAQHDAQCMRTVHRLNEAVLAMLEECLRAFEQYKGQAEHVEDTRRRGLEEVCRHLRGELDAHLMQLQRINTSTERDLRDARASLGDQLRTKAALRPAAEAAPFQHAIRHACSEVVRQATHAFPHPSTPAPTEAAMDAIANRVQRCSASFTVQALDPLASSSVALAANFTSSPLFTTGGTTTSSSSAASSPVISKATTVTTTGGSMGSPALMDLAPMPRLSPPMSAGASADATRWRVRSSVSPQATALMEDEDGREAEDETSTVSSSNATTARQTRCTTQPPPGTSPSQLQRASVRASSLRGSAALSAVPVNRVPGRTNDARRAGGLSGESGRCKRTRSTASSSRGEAVSRRTTSTHRAMR